MNEDEIELNDDEKINNDKDKKSYLKSIIAVVTVIGSILFKFKSILVFLKFGKFAGTFISMFVTLVVYAKIYGFSFGLGLVFIILVHEMGHYMTARYLKLNTSMPLFIPFVGAFISMKEAPKDALVEAKVAFGGPAVGTIVSIILMILGYQFDVKILIVIAYVGFILNLFNLLPIIPLDGGRITKAISPKIWFIGIPICIFIMIVSFSPIFLLIIILGISEMIGYFKNKNIDYYLVPLNAKIYCGLGYFSLLIVLAALIFETTSYLKI